MSDNEQPSFLTVAELIALLDECPLDATVYLEGCDCINRALNVEDEGNGNVLITI